jgi:hypothetical protein
LTQPDARALLPLPILAEICEAILPKLWQPALSRTMMKENKYFNKEKIFMISHNINSEIQKDNEN